MSYYDQIAQIYESQYAEEQNAKMRTSLSSTKLVQNDLVLDMGCGTGLLFQHIIKSAKLLIGIDTSSKILKEAKKRVKRFSNIFIICADADYTPFQNNIFDHVFAITLLQNMPNPLKTLLEIRRISKHDSTIIISGLKKKFTNFFFTNLLNKSGLKFLIPKENSQLKDYLAFCKK